MVVSWTNQGCWRRSGKLSDAREEFRLRAQPVLKIGIGEVLALPFFPVIRSQTLDILAGRLCRHLFDDV
jgi:hypothetical protein